MDIKTAFRNIAIGTVINPNKAKHMYGDLTQWRESTLLE